MKLTSKSLIAALTFGMTAMASAQDSGTVDAIATLESTSPPLSVTGATSLSFGAVNIPNGTQVGHSCLYNVGVGGVVPNFAVRELDENGGFVSSSAPTPSACDWGGGGTPSGEWATFSIVCNPATPVSYQASVTSGGVTGVELQDPFQGYYVALFSSSTGQYLYNSSSAGTITSYACPADGNIEAGVGGSIVVETNAAVATDVTVGTVTLEATY